MTKTILPDCFPAAAFAKLTSSFLFLFSPPKVASAAVRVLSWHQTDSFLPFSFALSRLYGVAV